MWEFDLDEHQTLQELYDSTHKDIWKVLFKSGKSWPGPAEDRGYQSTHSPSSVTHSHTLSVRALIGILCGRHPNRISLPPQGRVKKVERLHCPAPLPEEPAGPLLTKMLVPASYDASTGPFPEA